MITYEFKKGSGATVNIRDTYGVRVESGEGLIGKPALKSAETFDWKYLHGSTPDLANRRYQDREIKLKCWMKADSKQDMIERFNNFINYLKHDGLIFMHVTFPNTSNPNQGVYGNTKGLFYLVYLQSVGEVSFKWRTDKQVLRFTLTLKEPTPVKRVWRYSNTFGSGGGLNYNIHSETEIDLYLTNGEEVIGITNGSGTIACEKTGTYYLIAAGEVSAATITVTKLANENRLTLIYEEI